MTWPELIFPALGDLVMIGVALAFGYYIRSKLPTNLSPWASRAVLLGAGLVVVYFLADLMALIVLPAADVAATREFLLVSIRPYLAMICIVATLGGFMLVARGLTTSVQAAEAASNQLRETLQALPDGLLTLDSEQRIIAANPTAQEMLGGKTASPVGQHVSALFPEYNSKEDLGSERLAARSLSGKHFPAEISRTTISDNRQLILVRDITDTAGLEAQLRQSQKMESLGRLAGGIAHDFNNYLTVVLGEVELLDPHHPISDESVTRIREAAERAAGLTNQLLSFSRKQVLDTTVFDPTLAIENMHGLLSNVLGKEVQLRYEHDNTATHVQVDCAQFEQVIVNLAINARDAMASGGEVNVQIGSVYLDDAFTVRHPDIEAGDYVLVAVKDAGSGMSPDIQEHIFEPFYTTKPRGRGTGLGLAMVMGFIKQSRGTIEVESVEGSGTTMRMYLPASQTIAPLETTPNELANKDLGGGGMVLVAEDDPAVRAFVVKALTQAGYDVIDFDNATDASAALSDGVNLLLTDIVMPNGSGYDLAREAVDRYPVLPVLYMTGYIDDVTVEAEGPAPPGDTLRKPFSVRELLAAVQENLNPEAMSPLAAERVLRP